MSIVRVLFLVIIAFRSTDGFFHASERCEKISIPLCGSVLPYNLTRFPNLLGDRSQVFANISMLRYGSLIEHSNCSKNAVFFFCSFFLPICVPGIHDHDDSEDNIFKPCRSLCEQVRSDCYKKMGPDEWPSFAKCEELPQFSASVCISPESFISAPKPSSHLDNDAYRGNPAADYDQFDYVIRFKVVLIERLENKTIIRGRVREVFKQGNVTISKGRRRVKIWSSSNSTGPSLVSGKAFLIGGHEDASKRKLLLSSTSLIVAWSKQTCKRIRKWRRQETNGGTKGGRSCFRVPET